MSDIREEFEAAYDGDSEGTYFVPELNIYGCWFFKHKEKADLKSSAWYWWQASRAALKVELPKPEYFGDHWSGDWAYNVEDTKDALREAGIEVVK